MATADSQEFQGESRRPLKTGRPATGLVFIFASAKTSTPTERWDGRRRYTCKHVISGRAYLLEMHRRRGYNKSLEGDIASSLDLRFMDGWGCRERELV